MLSDIKDSHGPSDAMHNPSQPLKVGKTLFQNSRRFTHFYHRLSHSELVDIEKNIRVNSFTMKMEILLEPTSNMLMVDPHGFEGNLKMVVKIIMANMNHDDEVPVVEPNQHNDVPVVPEPVLEDEDEDPKEEEFKEEE
ncbi:hypothetical protein Tco_0596977 [Tanacetum coccineum]